MLEIDHPRIDVDALLARVRQVSARAPHAPAQPPSPLPPPPAAAVPAGGGTGGNLDRHLEAARGSWRVGEQLPPMSRRTGLVRRLAEPTARAFLRVAQLITRDQRTFNESVVGALDAVKDGLRKLEQSVSAAHQGVAAAGAEARAATGKLAEHAGAIGQLQGSQQQQAQGAAELRTELERLRARLAQQDHRLTSALFDLARSAAAGPATPAVPGAQDPKDLEQRVAERAHTDFEDRFRGTREAIKERSQAYLEMVRAAGLGKAESPVLDLGCGRGEWLDLLKEHGLAARGADANLALVESCVQRGLSVERADALRLLRSLPDASVGAVTAIHILEHMPPAEVEQVVGEIARVLVPGGMTILETPNPRNLVVGACNFYLDATHVRPIHPEWLAYVLEQQGLTRVSLRFSSPDPRHRTEPLPDVTQSAVNEFLFGPQDYAAIGYRP